MGFFTLWHYVKKLWPWRKRHSLKEFRENYVAEGAPAYFADLREISHFPSQCTTCGLCDVSCPLLIGGKHGDFVGPMRLVSSGMRGGPMLTSAEVSFRYLTSDQCLSCGACEKACPENIPILELSKCFLTQINEINSMKK